MNMRSLIAMWSLWSLCLTVYGQGDFKKGFIVLTDGDTIAGAINCKAFAGMPKNPTFIQFKGEPTARAVRYRAADLSYFEIFNGDIYQRAELSLEDISDYEDGELRIRSWRQTLWLRVVVQGGVISLYRWNNRFFVMKGNNYFVELKDESMDDSGYKSQLRKFAEHFGLLDQLIIAIEQCRFSEDDLSNVIVYLNKGKSRKIPLQLPGCKLDIFGCIGVGIGGIDLYTVSNTPTIHFVNKGMLYFSTGSEFFPKSSTLSFRLDLSYFSGSFNGVSTVYPYAKGPVYFCKLRNITTGISVLNTFYDDGMIAVYGGLCLNQHFSYYQRNFTTVLLSGAGWEDNIEMKRSWRSLGLSAGVSFYQRFDANLLLQPAVAFSTGPGAFVKSRSIFLCVRYHFKGRCLN